MLRCDSPDGQGQVGVNIPTREEATKHIPMWKPMRETGFNLSLAIPVQPIINYISAKRYGLSTPASSERGD